MLNFYVKRFGFTLAEVLITLAIIGVVAAMTIPTLITKINNRVRENQKAVIEKRFVEGLNLFNTLENGMSGKQHNSTYEFLQGLSKHFKMTSICDTEHITDCYPYENINYEENGEVKSFSVSKIKTANNINLNSDDYYTPAAFITASGVPFIVALKKDCIDDPDQPLNTYSQCIDGLYDMNGTRSPNRVGENSDVQSIRNASISKCVYKIGSGDSAVCAQSAFFHPTQAEAQAAGAACSSIVANNGKFTDGGKEYTVTGVTKCPYSTDYWLAAKMACAKQGLDFPTHAQLSTLADAVYGSPRTYSADAVKNAQKKYGFHNYGSDTAPWFLVWSRLENSSGDDYACSWYFTYNNTNWGGNPRDYSNGQAFCVAP